jgi:hypothetical protein
MRHVEANRPRDSCPRSTRQVDSTDELASTNSGVRERRRAGDLKIDPCSLSPTCGIASKHF